MNYQVRKIYGTSSAREPVESLYRQAKRRFYGKPDTEIKMKDYIKLPVMQEVFFELLPGVSLKSKKSGYKITINNPENFNNLYDTTGFICWWCYVRSNNNSRFLSWNHWKNRCNQGKVLCRWLPFTGIVNIITKAGDFSSNIFLIMP